MNKVQKTVFSKIAIRMPNWLGDAVMASGIFKLIKEKMPTTHVTALIAENFVPLLQKNPYIDCVYAFSRNKTGKKKENQRLIEYIKKEKFDVGLLLTGSFSSAWQFFRGGVPRRIGYPTHMRRLLLSDVVQQHEEHQVYAYDRLLTPLGIISQSSPEIFLAKDEIKIAKNKFLPMSFQRLVGINPGAAYGSAKCWPEEYFVILTQRILENFNDVEVVFFGDKTTSPLVTSITKHFSHRVYNLAAQTSLRDLFSLFASMNLIISNDSGPMHVAAALKIPLIALFGATNSFKTGCFQNGTILQHKPFCSPCCLRACPLDFRCMLSLLPEEVFQEVQKVLHE